MITRRTPAPARTRRSPRVRHPPDLDWIRAAPEDASGPGPWIEPAFGEGDGPDDPEAPVHLRETSAPANVVTTDRRKRDAFALGVQKASTGRVKYSA